MAVHLFVRVYQLATSAFKSTRLSTFVFTKMSGCKLFDFISLRLLTERFSSIFKSRLAIPSLTPRGSVQSKTAMDSSHTSYFLGLFTSPALWHVFRLVRSVTLDMCHPCVQPWYTDGTLHQSSCHEWKDYAAPCWRQVDFSLKEDRALFGTAQKLDLFSSTSTFYANPFCSFCTYYFPWSGDSSRPYRIIWPAK